jgi:hypothetical protein
MCFSSQNHKNEIICLHEIIESEKSMTSRKLIVFYYLFVCDSLISTPWYQLKNKKKKIDAKSNLMIFISQKVYINIHKVSHKS